MLCKVCQHTFMIGCVVILTYSYATYTYCIPITHIQDYGNLYFLMDLHHEHGDLWSKLRYQQCMVGCHSSLIRIYAYELLSALEHCHRHGIVHRDIKVCIVAGTIEYFSLFSVGCIRCRHTYSFISLIVTLFSFTKFSSRRIYY